MRQTVKQSVNKPTAQNLSTTAYDSVADLLSKAAPESAVYCFRPHLLQENAQEFISLFKGDVLYAVKCCDEPEFLRALWDGGIRHFDTASLPEIATVKSLFPEAKCYFMHPVKAPEAITAASLRYDIRHFAVDHADELAKVVTYAQGQKPIIMVRLDPGKAGAIYDLSGKFGCSVDDAVSLMESAHAQGLEVGICFHVGSQCLTPQPYEMAIELVRQVLNKTNVPLVALDVGGGFPAPYVGAQPDSLAEFCQRIDAAIQTLNLPPECQIMSEPGRALVANGASVLTRVELRRQQTLYLNDGVYGSLADLKFPGINFPMVAHRINSPLNQELADFSFCGPTCDTYDMLKGPYRLPKNIAMGDYIEFGLAGAYTMATRTRFNGFYAGEMIAVRDRAFAHNPPPKVSKSKAGQAKSKLSLV